MFAYNTTVSSSTGVTPQYAMFGCKATLSVDWVFPTPSVEKRKMYQWMGDMLEERQHAYKSMRDGKADKTAERPDLQTVNPEYLSQSSNVVFRSKNNTWN